MTTYDFYGNCSAFPFGSVIVNQFDNREGEENEKKFLRAQLQL